jgi:hypothetical protein
VQGVGRILESDGIILSIKWERETLGLKRVRDPEMQFGVSVYWKAGSRDPRMQSGKILECVGWYPGRREDPGMQGGESWNAGSGIL